MKPSKVLIAGAGPGGLAAAVALLDRGFDVEVYEQAPELREVGAGVQIAANGSRVLLALGLQEALERVAAYPTGKEVRLWDTGQSWPLFDLGASSVQRYGAPYLMLHRADLHDALAAAVRARKPDAIHLGARAVGFEQSDAGVRLRLADGRSADGDVLIGADGLHSQIRQQLFGAAKPRFTGGIAWRGVIPMDKLPAHLRLRSGVNWIGPKGHIINYPLRRGELLNFVGHIERSDWQVESWTERGTVEECLADFEGWSEDVRTIIAHIEEPFKWALFLREPLQRWSEGRVSLLGDACHATLPYLAQGVNMALEDGLVLARCLEAERNDPARGLQRYEAARIDRTSEIVNRSADMLTRFHNPKLADPATAAHYVENEWRSSKVDERYDWLFRYDATRVEI